MRFRDSPSRRRRRPAHPLRPLSSARACTRTPSPSASDLDSARRAVLDAPVSTLTLAEIYARQGLHGRAREILQRLSAEGNPGRGASSPRWETGRGGRSSFSPTCSPGSRSAGENANVGFREDLEAICGRVEGAFAASLMGFDGIAIETAQVNAPSGLELTTVIVEYSGILSQVRQAAESLQMGKASED